MLMLGVVFAACGARTELVGGLGRRNGGGGVAVVLKSPR